MILQKITFGMILQKLLIGNGKYITIDLQVVGDSIEVVCVHG